MSYEIEIKTLLGSADNAEEFRNKILGSSDMEEVGHTKQLNHYFAGDDVAASKLYESVRDLVNDSAQQDKLYKITHESKKRSVRTREIDGQTVILVIKASVDDTTSENGIARMEVELNMHMSLEELDSIILKAGFEYQAKWSRAREEYRVGNTVIALDRNAGYGYLAEFERVIEDEVDAKEVELGLREMMVKFGVEELKQDRLARMFDFYNKNWREYYGTEKVFTIE